MCFKAAFRSIEGDQTDRNVIDEELIKEGLSPWYTKPRPLSSFWPKDPEKAEKHGKKLAELFLSL